MGYTELSDQQYPVGKDMEGGSCVLFEGNIPAFTCRELKIIKSLRIGGNLTGMHEIWSPTLRKYCKTVKIFKHSAQENVWT
jgi:hypothetical protein